MQYSADISGRQTDPAITGKTLRAAGLGAFFRPSQLTPAGFSRDQRRSLLRRGVIEPVGRGLYRIADVEPTENYSLAMVCARAPAGIVCLLSALRVHGIGSQSPNDVWLGIPHKARAPSVIGIKVRVVRFSGAAWAVGINKTQFEGVPAWITSKARTVVDCFRLERLLGPEAPIEALQDALRRRLVTVDEIRRVEEMLPSRRLRAHLERGVI